MYAIQMYAYEYINEQLKESPKNLKKAYFIFYWCTTNLPAKYGKNRNLMFYPLGVTLHGPIQCSFNMSYQLSLCAIFVYNFTQGKNFLT